MIPVTPQPPPRDFDSKVRTPGLAFLAKYPDPTRDDYKKKGSKIWQRALGDLYQGYGKICAYNADWIKSKEKTLDHFISRNTNKMLAFEWTNFRLASALLNQNKSSHSILDPFLIQPNWFVIDFDLNIVRSNADLDTTVRSQIERTIDILKLNELILQTKRTNWIDAYYRERVGLEGLRKRAPFIVYELERQKLVDEIKVKHERFLRMTGKL